MRCSVAVETMEEVTPFVCATVRAFQVASRRLRMLPVCPSAAPWYKPHPVCPVHARRESRSVKSYFSVSGPILAGTAFGSTGGSVDALHRQRFQPPITATVM